MTTSFNIRGMDCAEEVAALKAELEGSPGIQSLRFDVLNAKMTVIYSRDMVDDTSIITKVARTGMHAEPWRDIREDAAVTGGWSRWGRTVTTSASGALIVAGTLVNAITYGWRTAVTADETATLAQALYAAATFLGAWHVASKAWRAALRLRPDMNLLMVVAVIGAIAIGEFFEAATVSFLFAVSLALESWSVGRARRAISALMALSPETARVVQADGSESVVPASNVTVGTTVVVRPGDRFPLDGRIRKGETTVNQAPITGESMPVAKSASSEVFAGTINQDGAVEVVTTKLAQDTTLAQIIKLVGSAQSKRGPSEQWVEKFARVYTPAVMGLSVVVILLSPLLFGTDWLAAVYSGLVLLVIACPCALVISTPVSIVAALTAAARQGVLVKGGEFIEAPATLRAIAVDKTGTLTEGRPEVQQIVPLSGHGESEVLQIAAAVEMRSEHPLAQAIVRAAARRGIRPAPADDFRAIPGKGATARIDGEVIWIGSHRHLEERGQETPEMHETLTKLAESGSSVVVVGKSHHVCGLIAVADQIRADARRAVESLHAVGVRPVVMLTGDNRGTAAAVASKTGIDDFRAELLPADKVLAIEELVRQHGKVAMVGDGVNDAPALARATIGIAMGAVGTDAALETADIALMSDDLSKIAWLVTHSRRTLRIIRQNIFLSLGTKIMFVVLTFAGVSTLWAAIAADMGTSLLVIFNGLRLLRSSPA